jgi:hypothetical protein
MDPLEQELIRREAEHADPAVARALALLLEEERPTVPIRVIDPDPKLYPIFRIRPNAEGITDQRKREIFVNRKAPSFGDDALLASVLAHEMEHARRIGQPDQYDEGPAYERQLAVLKRLGYKNLPYIQALERETERRRKADRR